MKICVATGTRAEYGLRVSSCGLRGLSKREGVMVIFRLHLSDCRSDALVDPLRLPQKEGERGR